MQITHHLIGCRLTRYAVVQQVVSNPAHARHKYCYVIYHCAVSQEPLGVLAHKARSRVYDSFHYYGRDICLHTVSALNTLKAFLEREEPLCLYVYECALYPVL